MYDMEFIEKRFVNISKALSSNDVKDNIIKAKNIVLRTRERDNKIIFAGNGASTTIASHGALDFMSQLGVKSYCVNDPNLITCYSNDFGYENFVKRYIQFTASKYDLIVLISSSGESLSMLAAAEEAIKRSCNVITLTGFNKNNSLRKLGNINLWTDSKEYNVVECVHNAWIVTICDAIAKDETGCIGIHGREF